MDYRDMDYFVFKVADDYSSVINSLAQSAYDDSTTLSRLCRQAGWQGGTIHQVADYILDHKRKWNAGSRNA